MVAAEPTSARAARTVTSRIHPASRSAESAGRASRSARAAHSPSLTGTTPRLQTFTPAHLAEKILHSRAALEGERK